MSETRFDHGGAVRDMVSRFAGDADPTGVEIGRLVRIVRNLYEARIDEGLRDQGLSGQATSEHGPVRLTFDNSLPDSPHGILMGLIRFYNGLRDFTRAFFCIFFRRLPARCKGLHLRLPDGARQPWLLHQNQRPHDGRLREIP